MLYQDYPPWRYIRHLRDQINCHHNNLFSELQVSTSYGSDKEPCNIEE